jgi:hypothetical protein
MDVKGEAREVLGCFFSHDVDKLQIIVYKG